VTLISSKACCNTNHIHCRPSLQWRSSTVRHAAIQITSTYTPSLGLYMPTTSYFRPHMCSSG